MVLVVYTYFHGAGVCRPHKNFFVTNIWLLDILLPVIPSRQLRRCYPCQGELSAAETEAGEWAWPVCLWCSMPDTSNDKSHQWQRLMLFINSTCHDNVSFKGKLLPCFYNILQALYFEIIGQSNVCYIVANPVTQTDACVSFSSSAVLLKRMSGQLKLQLLSKQQWKCIVVVQHYNVFFFLKGFKGIKIHNQESAFLFRE